MPHPRDFFFASLTNAKISLLTCNTGKEVNYTLCQHVSKTHQYSCSDSIKMLSKAVFSNLDAKYSCKFKPILSIKAASIKIYTGREERKIQIQRILGLTQLVHLNKMFPVASSVLMDSQTLKKARELGILVVKIERPFDQILKIRSIYQGADNVVGKDIKLDQLDARIIYNMGNESFSEVIYDLVNQNIENKNANKI